MSCKHEFFILGAVIALWVLAACGAPQSGTNTTAPEAAPAKGVIAALPVTGASSTAPSLEVQAPAAETEGSAVETVAEPLKDALAGGQPSGVDSQAAAKVEDSMFRSPLKTGGMVGDRAPEFTGILEWINSEPLTMQELRGKVVLVNFWTYTCVNCINTMPYLKDWHAKYADQGLVIVGVHSPEFEFEKPTANVVEATVKFGLEYPVAQDNDFATWWSYDNRYWPAEYLVDKDGVIRYRHFGEGAYEETENLIRILLQETGVGLSGVN